MEAFIHGIVVVAVLFMIIDEVMFTGSVTSTIVAVARGGVEFVVPDVFDHATVVLVTVVVVLISAAVLIVCVGVTELFALVSDNDDVDADVTLRAVVVDTSTTVVGVVPLLVPPAG